MGFVAKKKEKRWGWEWVGGADCELKVDVKSIPFVAMETVRNGNVYIEVY